jgi:hypothetical protein
MKKTSLIASMFTLISFSVLSQIGIALLLVISLTGCFEEEETSSVFNTSKLEGKYGINIMPLVHKATDETFGDSSSTTDNITQGLVYLLASSFKGSVSFYPDEKGVTDIKFMGDHNINKFEYKVENDSILFIKTDNDSILKSFGTLKKFNDNYDYLSILTTKVKNKRGSFEIELIKLTEEVNDTVKH